MKRNYRSSLTANVSGFVVAVVTMLQLPHTQASTIGYWRMTGTPNTTVTALNSDPVGLTATPVSGTATYSGDVPGSGAQPSSLSTPWAYTGLQTAYNPILQPTSAFTIEGFFKVNPAPLWGPGSHWSAYSPGVGMPNTTAGFNSYSLGVFNGGLGYAQVDTSTGIRNLVGNIFVDDNQWHEMALTYSAGAWNFYIDYQYQTSSSGAVAYDGSSGFFFGGNGAFGAPFGGLIDEVRLSNVALTPAEFLTVPEPGTLALWLSGALVLAAWRRRQHA